MAANIASNEKLNTLAYDIREANCCSELLMHRVVSEACTRLPALRAKAGVDRLVAAVAWTDAALAIIKLEMPAWSLRRLSR